MRNIDNYFMQQSLTLANRGRLTVSPNPMVGCLVVKDGSIVSEGWHTMAGKSHAEVDALKKIGGKAKGATVYVTLEPCCYSGKTAPCTTALIQAQVDKVVIATLDPNPKVAGKGAQKLKAAGIEVKIGVLEKQAQNLNKIFFHYQESKIPFVFAKWAMSLDGKMSVNGDDSRQISSKQSSMAHAHQLRNICDAILIGKNTLISDNPSLDVRININRIKHPVRFVVFSAITVIDHNWKVIKQKQSKTIFVGTYISDQLKVQLDDLGIEYWILATKSQNQVCLLSLLKKMASVGITSLLVEGGKKILESFISQNLVNEFNTYLSAVLIASCNPKKNLFFNSIAKTDKDLFINASFTEQRKCLAV